MKFKGKAFKSGGSYVVVIPKDLFDAGILDPDKEYEFEIKNQGE